MSAYDAADKLLIKRREDRHPLQKNLLARQCIHLLFQRIIIHGKTLLGVSNFCQHRPIANTNAHMQEVIVRPLALP